MEDRESKSEMRVSEPSISYPSTSNRQSSLSSAFLPWTTVQRQALISLCILLLFFLAFQSWRMPALLSDPPGKTTNRGEEIQDRVDPNTADAAALAAIPNLGEKHAQQIVEYREKFLRLYPNRRAFDSPDDLLRLKGIGIATVNNLSPYLLFANDRPGGSSPTLEPSK